MGTSSIINKNYGYTEMREGMDQLGLQLLTATGKVWRSWYEQWTINSVFCSGYNASTLFQIPQKWSLSCSERGTLQTCYP